MARYVALLRAVNVGGTGKLAMKDLRETLETAGYLNIRTLLASGNVVMDAAESSAPRLEQKLEALLYKKHDLSSDIMVRSPVAWRAIVRDNPMLEQAESAPSALGVMVMKGLPNAKALVSFVESWKGAERISIGKGCIYIYYPSGMGQSKLKIPTTVGIGTVRNWNTVRKLRDLIKPA